MNATGVRTVGLRYLGSWEGRTAGVHGRGDIERVRRAMMATPKETSNNRLHRTAHPRVFCLL